MKGNCHPPPSTPLEFFFGKAHGLNVFVRENLAVSFPKSVPRQLERSFYFRVLPEFTLVWTLLLTRWLRDDVVDYRILRQGGTSPEHLFSIVELVSKHAIARCSAVRSSERLMIINEVSERKRNLRALAKYHLLRDESRPKSKKFMFDDILPCDAKEKEKWNEQGTFGSR